ncbi:PepSY-associated TM helix domain-containing protein [Fodinibius salsisoli]|uniref:PepSY domain-containing protein n=1 Tax=Fodinibius salsisoli TaxID=2820877 RepID=A0ABT3PNW6_9BACT|nr:PepSY-associated TM helix domain-containing protein [Fodinibius salsisoli]MCW9707552.1 PepSY domain-containing protein [Fodinibius salsisoli]
MPSFKETTLFLHRWLGIITGLVVVILSVTGCLYVFHHEISGWIRYDTFHADNVPANQQTLPVEKLQKKTAEALNTSSLPYGLVTYKDPARNWSAMLYKGGRESWTYFGSMEVYKTAYINPYNGEIEGIVNEKKDFFQIVKGIHWSLLLATPIGQPIIAWSTIIFIVLLITGMVLWWPKKWNRAGKQKSFKIMWRGTWRRINYDLHNVLGFYFLILSLIIAFTGLYWYMPSVKKSIHFIGTGEYKLPAGPSEKVVSTIPDSAGISSPQDVVYANAWEDYPTAYSIAITAPTDSQSTIRASVRPDGQTYYGSSSLQFDQYSGELLSADRYQDQNAGEKLLSMNYDIHVGAIGGLPGKIIAFFASLACASLPITGFIIWFDRKRRQWAREKTVQKRKTKSTSRKPKVPV